MRDNIVKLVFNTNVTQLTEIKYATNNIYIYIYIYIYNMSRTQH